MQVPLCFDVVRGGEKVGGRPFSRPMWMCRQYARLFPQIEQLLSALYARARPSMLRRGGCLEAEVAHGNHSSILAHTSKIMDKIVSDVMLGRALVFDTQFINEILDLNLRVSPFGVVEEPKFRIIHDLTFAAEGRTSVIADTDFGRAPEC